MGRTSFYLKNMTYTFHKIAKLRTFALSALLMASLALHTNNATAQTYTPAPENLAARDTFSNNRFGIFLHWGLYSMFAQGEWYMTNDDINHAEYAKAAQAFYPHNFDAQKWIAAIKDAGAKYICFTTRHHEGFSMWDTQSSDYKITNTPYGKDILKQLADACHEQHIGLHLYYSHLDWTRSDYPIGRTGRGTGRTLKPDWPQYYRFMNSQLTELLTNYGKIDCIWFDGVWDHDHDSVPFDWQLTEQYALIHRLQPACLIGNNHHQTPNEGEDIQIFERDVPGENKAGLSGQDISRLPLETCQTMNGMWGYKVKDQDYKSTTELIRLLARTSAKGANLLLNIGPQPDGSLPATALNRLHEMGQWLKQNGRAIYGTQGVSYAAGGDSIVMTRTDRSLFVHILSPDVKEVTNLPITTKAKNAVGIADGKQFKVLRKGKVVTITGIEVPDGAADYVIELKM